LEPAIPKRPTAYQQVSETDSIVKLPGPKPKTEILLRVIAASLLLPLIELEQRINEVVSGDAG
jgi:hypothetical protein